MVHVPFGSMVDAKIRLLADAVAYVADHGVADQSLRQIAAALGTSHRMLIYHFGSKQGLFVAIIKQVEARQRAVLDDLVAEPGESPGELARRFWRRISDPALWPNARLFFERSEERRAGKECRSRGSPYH